MSNEVLASSALMLRNALPTRILNYDSNFDGPIPACSLFRICLRLVWPPANDGRAN
jgi:hypothetical protein